MVFQQRRVTRFIWLAGGVAIALIAAPVTALMDSVGEAGIDARRLHESPYSLTGEKIAIGQVEIGRPAVSRLDKTSPLNAVVRVRQVFFRDLAPTPDELVDGHAANVASVMISQDKSHTGVAPNARLYSSAVGILEDNGQPEECLAAQTVALQNGGDVRASNFSFGESLARDPRPDAMLDGNALLTQCIDWSSNVHGILYVIAGNQGRGGIPIPTDNFNGVNVSNSTRINGRFTKVDYSSLSSEPELIVGRREDLESNVGPRRSLSLVAPGTNIEMFNPDGQLISSTGTSFAAPHVTATVALIQEFGDRQIRENAPNWSIDSRNPQVSKVILMNSADKIEDQGDGRNLGMSRTLLSHRNLTWVDQDAYSDQTRPLSADFGTGHLNAYRAVQQFQAGQWNPDDPVPVMGWDYRTVASAGETPAYRDYVIDEPLEAGSYLSATLAWSRQVQLKDDNGNELYDIGESFEDLGLNNLNLYLMRVDDTDTSDAVWSSISEVDSVEHIFHQVPETGRYKIRVVYTGQVNEPVQPYALAWWGKAATATTPR
ncbi:MAG: S8 family serine peptidase [Synechococcales bacterium]|nr:S8 family serine peptidase [Synechococcales bacterium]